MSIKYTVRGDVWGISLSLFKGYGLSLSLPLPLYVPSFFGPPLHRDSPLLHSPLEIIKTLHLLIIWTCT